MPCVTLDWSALRQGTNPAFLTVVSLEYADGWTESYFVPLALLTGEEAERVIDEVPASVLARVTGARKGAIVDGVYDSDTCNRVLELCPPDAALPMPAAPFVARGFRACR